MFAATKWLIVVFLFPIQYFLFVACFCCSAIFLPLMKNNYYIVKTFSDCRVFFLQNQHRLPHPRHLRRQSHAPLPPPPTPPPPSHSLPCPRLLLLRYAAASPPPFTPPPLPPPLLSRSPLPLLPPYCCVFFTPHIFFT